MSFACDRSLLQQMSRLWSHCRRYQALERLKPKHCCNAFTVRFSSFAVSFSVLSDPVLQQWSSDAMWLGRSLPWFKVIKSKKVKDRTAVNGTPSHSYGTSPATSLTAWRLGLVAAECMLTVRRPQRFTRIKKGKFQVQLESTQENANVHQELYFMSKLLVWLQNLVIESQTMTELFDWLNLVISEQLHRHCWW